MRGTIFHSQLMMCLAPGQGSMNPWSFSPPAPSGATGGTYPFGWAQRLHVHPTTISWGEVFSFLPQTDAGRIMRDLN